MPPDPPKPETDADAGDDAYVFDSASVGTFDPGAGEADIRKRRHRSWSDIKRDLAKL